MSKDKTTQNTNTVSGSLVYKQFIQLDDGSEVQVRYNQDPSLYLGTGVTLYEYKATEGKGTERKEVTRYAVAVNDALRASRTTTKDKIASLKNSGMTADEILALLEQ